MELKTKPKSRMGLRKTKAERGKTNTAHTPLERCRTIGYHRSGSREGAQNKIRRLMTGDWIHDLDGITDWTQGGTNNRLHDRGAGQRTGLTTRLGH